MDPGTVDQERVIKQLVRKAEDTGSPTHPIRKDCLKKLIDVAHTSEALLKKLAAENIPKFYKVFPDLEEDAINAIYDLCEDPEPKVRVDGYSAIVHLSKEQRKWVKRNADVLVQLLQADEPDEVASVKKALSSHVDLDPQVTFGVLCEQLVPQEDSADEDERAARDHLRYLVLSYMTGDIMRIQRHASKPDNENVLVDGLLKAIMSVGQKERRTIVKDILLCLPSLKPRSSDRVNDELLTRLLARVRPLLDTDMNPQTQPCVFSEHTQILLELAVFVCAELDKAVANPGRLMRFFSHSILPSGMGIFAAEAKVFFMTLLGETWAACETRIDDRERDLIRKYVTDCTSSLLPGLCEVRPTDARTWKITEKLLSLCIDRLNNTPWQLNGTTHSLHVELIRILEDSKYEEQLKDVNTAGVRELVKCLCDRYQPNQPLVRRENRREARRRRSPSPISIQERKVEVPLPDSDRSQPASRPRRSPSPRRHSPSPRPRSPSPRWRSPSPPRRRSPSSPSRRRSLSPPPRRRTPTPPSAPLSIRGQSARDRERDLPPHLRGQPPSQPRSMPLSGPRAAQENNDLKRRERSPDRGRGRSPTPPKRPRMHSPPRDRGRDRRMDNNKDRERDTWARDLPLHVPRAPAAASKDNGRPPPASTSRRSPSPHAPAPAPSSGSGAVAVTGWSIKGAATREPLPPQSLLTRMANLDPEPRRKKRGGRNKR